MQSSVTEKKKTVEPGTILKTVILVTWKAEINRNVVLAQQAKHS
jgi:hypothetical protein